MKKKFTILLILIFSLGLFSFKFFVLYGYAAYPDPIPDESLYPKITSVSSTANGRPAGVVRRGDTVEVLGENFNNGEISKLWLTNPSGYVTGITSWTDNKIVLNFEYGSGYGTYGAEDLKFRINYFDKIGNLVYVLSEPFTGKDVCHSSYDDWVCPDYGSCQEDGTQTRICVRSNDCQELTNPKPQTIQSCYYAPLCTDDNWSCTNWSTCNLLNHTQTRNCTRNPDCQGGVSRPTTQSCTYIPSCYYSDWSCSSWSACSSSGSQARSCNKTSNCEGGIPSPVTSQSCTYVPACSVDTWQCGNWGICSPQGIQTRSCSKTFDCSSVETASPAVSQYCVAPNQPKQQSPTEDLGIVNQDSIIKSTVKLICPLDETMASQGSGTVVDSSGTILTNKHVIEGTPGCLVGFIDNYGDEPYFGDRQIADIYRVSSDTDVAILKLRNPANKNLTFVDITKGNSSLLGLGDKITTYGYPAKFGTKITYTSGDFSGVDGNYLKTTAIIEHGNSGGGAYLKNGTFIGIPSAVVKGSLNSLGYLLSVNKVNSWINGSSYAYDSGNSNNYSRVSSVLEDIDLNSLNSLKLFVANSNGSGQTEPTTGTNNKTVDKNLQNRLKGYILLQVESKGEAWYINPTDGKRYYMKDGATAYQMMRNFGLGISNANLSKMPKENEKNNYPSFVNKQKGKILLQVEAHGEAWYVNPKTGYRHYMKDGNAAYSLMRYYSLGISNKDLEKIPEGSL